MYFDNVTEHFDVTLSSVIDGFFHDFALISCFFDAEIFGCPAEVSIIPGKIEAWFLGEYDERRYRWDNFQLKLDLFSRP